MSSAVAAFTAIGTTCSVHVTRPEALAPARRILEAEVAAIDRACSRFRSDSGLARLNAAAGRPVAVEPLLLEAVQVALRAAALTDGLVDPTIGRALVLAGYDDDFARIGRRPGAVRAVRVPGWRTVRVDPGRGTVAVPRGVTLDLGATAKALAADRAASAAAAALADVGLLVDLGGDIATAGPAPAGGWTVRVVEDHRAPEGPGQTCVIASGAVATSSTTVRRWGPQAHHLIDPRSGTPSSGPWRTATVAAATCVDANTASTAAIVRGVDAPAWLRSLGLPARLLGPAGVIVHVGAWPGSAA